MRSKLTVQKYFFTKFHKKKSLLNIFIKHVNVTFCLTCPHLIVQNAVSSITQTVALISRLCVNDCAVVHCTFQFLLTCKQFSISPPCYVWCWFSTDRTLDVNIGPDHDQLVPRRLRQPLWRLCETKSQKSDPLSGKQWHPHKGARFKRTFHDHVEVVNCFSGCVLGFTHVLPSIILLCVGQEQKLPKVVKFCPGGQLLSHFHPLYFRNGTTKGNVVNHVTRQTTQQSLG